MTDGCRVKRFARMRYAYELGILGDDECREFEQHLLECEPCFADLRRFREAAELMKADPDVRETVRQSLPDEEAGTAGEPALPALVRPRGWIWWRVAPVALAAAVVVVFVLANWEVTIRPTPEAVAASNRLAVLYFKNVAEGQDSLHLSEIVTSLLATDLSESRYVQVVSSQWVCEILTRMGDSCSAAVDEATAARVAREAHARWLLTGRILQIHPQIVLTSQLVDVETGAVAASQRVTGGLGENVFSLVDRLTAAVKQDLSLPRAARQEADRRVADVTTHSAEAYRYYLEGIAYSRKYYTAEAASCFTRALEYDSTFAMAYHALAVLKDSRLIKKALEYADRTTWKEQHYIRSLAASLRDDMDGTMSELQTIIERHPDEKYALFSLGAYSSDMGKNDDAARYYTRVIDLDPRDKVALNMLAFVYDALGKQEQAIETVNAYIALAPDEPNPYDSRAVLYALHGRFDEAIASYRQALAIKPDFSSSLIGLGDLYLLQKAYAQAESTMFQFVSSPERTVRSEGRLRLAYIPLHQGKLGEALRILDEGIAADRLEQVGGWNNVRKHLLKATIYVERRDSASALQEIDSCIRIHDRDSPVFNQCYKSIYAELIAEAGDVARGRQMADRHRVFLEERRYPPFYGGYADGAIGLLEGNTALAVTELEKAAKASTDFYIHYMLGRAYLTAGRYHDAVRTFESALNTADPWRAFFGTWSAKIHYHLGLAFEGLAMNEQAARQYTTFLEDWRDADPGIPEIVDARTRLDRLRGPQAQPGA